MLLSLLFQLDVEVVLLEEGDSGENSGPVTSNLASEGGGEDVAGTDETMDYCVTCLESCCKPWACCGDEVRMLAVVNRRPRTAMDQQLESYRQVDRDNTNEFAFITINLPVGPLPLRDGSTEVEERVKACKAMMDKLKSRPEPWIIYQLSRFLRNTLGSWGYVVFALFNLRKASGYLSNLPGPRKPITIAGQQIVSMYNCVVPTCFGLGISILSYNGQIRLACSGDGSIMPRERVLNLLGKCDKAFNEICAAGRAQVGKSPKAE